MADGLASLRQYLTQAKPPIVLNAAYVVAGGAAPVPGLDEALTKAFRLGKSPGLAVDFDPATGVGPIDGDRFVVTGVAISFLGRPQSTCAARLRFRDGAGAIQVLVEVVLADWGFSTTFPAMTGFPFDLLDYATPTFVFSTEATTWQWSGGGTVTLAEPGQHFVGTLAVPDAFQPIFALVSGMPALDSVTMKGPAEVDQVTILDPPDPLVPPEAPAVLYPQLDLRGTEKAQVEVFMLKAHDPGVALTVPPPVDIEAAEPADELGLLPLGPDEPEVVYDQPPELSFVAKVDVGPLALDLQATLDSIPGLFGFGVMVDPDSPVKLTPGDLIALVDGGSSSFLSSVPGPLQQLVSRVGLQGIVLSGTTQPSAKLNSIGVSIGSERGGIPLFTDPTNGEAFALDSFEIAWTILDPLGKPPHTTLVDVSAELHLWKSVFPGAFEVSIDQDLSIDGRYRGSVSLAALLSGITMGAIQLPAGVAVEFSDFTVQVDPSAKSYSLACTLDATVDFVKLGPRPLIAIDEMELTLAASTPTAAGGSKKTAYRAGIAGFMSIGPLAANVSVRYDGTASPPVWNLDARLALPLRLSDLLTQLFRAYDLPSFLPGTVEVTAVAVGAEIPTAGPSPPAAGSAPRYDVSAAMTWDLSEQAGFELGAAVGLRYDGRRPGSEFSGSVVGRVHLNSFGTDVEVGYRFGTAAADALDLGRLHQAATAAGDSKTLWIAWEGIRGEYSIDQRKLTLTLAGWSAGRVIQSLVRTVGDPYFTLDPPWDFLNQISLDGLKLIWDFNPGVANRLSASYKLSSPVRLGFLTVNGLDFMRGADGQVKLAIAGSTTISSLQGPLFDPTRGQDVRNLPAVPGQGSQYFDLLLLMLGQRIAIRDAGKFDSTKAVIDALEKIPTSSGGTNPVNPTGGGYREPYYDRSRDWLVAAHFGLLKVGPAYTFECMVVFNDPDLYGLRLAANGDKAKVLAGLVIDVLYKKVTDDVGVYQIDFTFPKAIRQIDLGAFSVTLPTIGVDIYTNGDFLFDFGFPYNLDFSRSFGLQAIIMGVPVLGAAGFYFGRLSIGSAAGLPRSTPGRELIGSFSPAIVFGLGIQLGVGRTFQKGPFSAGFSITVFGIVEGVIAAWHPPDGAASASASSLQGDYFFRLKGTFGIIGKLYGSADFGIVRADVSLTVTLSAQITYQAFEDIELAATASVSVSVSIRIDLGLFSFTISFSFSATITAQLTIQVGDHDPPWYPKSLSRSRAEIELALLEAPLDPPRPRTVTGVSDPPTINLHPAPQFTVMSPGGTALSDQQGAFVLLVATDAPTADRTGNRESSSFGSLCERLFPWVIDALSNSDGATEVDLANVDTRIVSRTELQHMVKRLAANPIAESDIETKLLEPAFTVVLGPPATPRRSAALQAGATIFPPFTGLTLTVPAKSGSGTATVALADYVKVTPGYRDELNELFDRLAARVEQESGGDAAVEAADGGPEPLARFVFEDWFALVARQLLQAGADAIGDYAYPLDPSNDSIKSIQAWAHARGNTGVGPIDVAAPNLAHPLTAGKPLNIAGATYTVQQQDSLQAVAARYTDTENPVRWVVDPAQVALANQALQGLVSAGVEVELGGATYRTDAGESFASLAAALGTTVELLAADAALQQRKDLLAPAVVVGIPTFAYTVTDGDTLQSIQQRFDVPLAALVEDDANYALAGLFASPAGGPGFRIAGLDTLNVADVWGAIARTDQIAQVAGMVARFQLHGMRLPVESGLTLPQSGFLYPTGEPDYGLYQLTGQQFPAPPITPGDTYTMTLAKDSTLDWLELPQPSVDMTEQARELYYVLEYARANPFEPGGLTLEPEPAVVTEPKRWPLRTSTPWSSSDEGEITSLSDPSRTSPADAAGPQVTPIVWDLPDALLAPVAARQGALERRGLSTQAALPYLPVVRPGVATTDPASGHTSTTHLDGFAFATRIQFEVKRLAQTDDLAPPRPGQNAAVPPGPGDTGPPPALAPYNYELVGPSPADAVLLERLLTAADSVGKDLLAHLFLLYPCAGPASPGLTSRGRAEFLSFITRTNLSTETNPPGLRELRVEAAEQPTGIARPDEFVQLLWELSTVRSGGYYLHYQVLADGTGLPDTLFDSTGSAKLTLLVAYDRSLSAGTRVTDYVNALVTTDPVDVARSVVTVESRSEPVPSRRLTGVETLANVAALYGTDPGLLASLNAEVAFAGGSHVPIAGVVHQVSPADVATGDPLTAIAAYYSRGAQAPISKADLTGFNPGVTATLGAAVRIPPLTCVPSTSGDGPGPTFASLAAYYGLSYDALGFCARSVPGLYPPRTLTVDPLERDVHPGVGNGNAGVSLTRSALPDPPAYLESLYTMMSAGVLGTPFFDASPQGLPFGPRTSHTAEEAHALRDPERRRASLAAAAGGPLEYVQVLGYGAFARANAAPAGDAGGPLPPASANPYAGVGTLVQLHLRWLDIFGNEIVSALGQPPSGYQGPLNDVPVSLRYSDRIVGLGQWPNVRADYSYGGSAGAPELTVELRLEICAYDESASGWQQAAANDLETFTRVYFQLNQDYGPLKIPGLAGWAITMSLENTLLEQPERSLPDDEARQVRDFVSACLAYVWRRAQGQPGGDVPEASLTLPVATADVAAADVIPLALRFVLTRQAELTEPGLRDVAGGLRDATEIKPRTSSPASKPCAERSTEPVSVSIDQFASDAEAVLVTPAWQLRVGTSAAGPGGGGIDGHTLWAVRMAKAGGDGLGYTIDPGPSFYAPEPVATALRDGQATIGRYETGKKFGVDSDTLTFAGVDMNAWAQQALAAIDAFLTPTYTAPAFVVDELLVPDDPQENGWLAKILRHKETLAAAVARTVKPVLESSASDEPTRVAAEDKLHQTLLNQLGAAFTVTAVVVFPVSDAADAQPLPPGVVAPPRFYGQPLADLVDSAPASADAPQGQANFALSSAKVPLTPGGDSRLAFLFSSKSAAEQAFVPLKMTYSMSHLEHDIRHVPGIDGYEQSRWIHFVTGPFESPLSPPSGEVVKVPVVLRALPQPPSLTTQTGTPIHRDGNGQRSPDETPDQLARWNYAFAHLYRAAAQDTVSATVEFNRGKVGPLGSGADEAAALFGALAQFVTDEPAIAADLEAFLRPVDGNSKATDAGVVNAGYAIAAFEAITGDLASAYDAWSRRSPAPRTDVEGPVHVVYEFDIGLVRGPADRARVEIYADEGVPLPRVDLDPDLYERHDVTPDAPARAAYEYSVKGAAPATWLEYEDALGIPSRVVTYEGLDVFARQDGYSTIFVERNVHLGADSPTTTTFRFRTPDVRFADRLVPLIAHGGYDLGSVAPAPAALATYLTKFFDSLLSSADGQRVAVKMASGYRFRLVPAGTDMPATLLPIHLLPPTGTTPPGTPSFVPAVAEAVETWLASHPRPSDPDAEITFGLEVFAAEGLEQKPLLTVEDLHVRLGDLTLAAQA
ncbi:MAG: LysM peptidoglycan-binding domain-containing protein [Actinomycetota bacterium]|nr:LysM peptidoglycan-binding domain-containing protein [Actinomycetota bacterium]